jgi:hypothetical protein
MRDCRQMLILAATLLVAATGVALAEQIESPAQHTGSFWSWLFPSSTPVATPKSRPAAPPAGRLTSAPENGKPRPSCSLLNCITLVGIGF